MARFNEVTYESATQTAVIGAGNIWDDVYEILNAQGVNVVGARVTGGVGVAGLILGGGMYDDYTSTIYCLNGYLSAGYSWLSNQYGLALDNVVAYELVAPNTTVVTVTEESDPDLFFSLKVCALLLSIHSWYKIITSGRLQQLWYRYSVYLEGLPTGCCLGTYALEILVAITD